MWNTSATFSTPSTFHFYLPPPTTPSKSAREPLLRVGRLRRLAIDERTCCYLILRLSVQVRHLPILNREDDGSDPGASSPEILARRKGGIANIPKIFRRAPTGGRHKVVPGFRDRQFHSPDCRQKPHFEGFNSAPLKHKRQGSKGALAVFGSTVTAARTRARPGRSGFDCASWDVIRENVEALVCGLQSGDLETYVASRIEGGGNFRGGIVSENVHTSHRKIRLQDGARHQEGRRAT
ncbi:hypothetical protein B0H14DRAFT_2623818 [Mycena olivaceomarginata]|nr:hypothetical protein B0H14DRAFT_2623818 [Mycena olivaceomarginata]